jgi:hypothetical protein
MTEYVLSAFSDNLRTCDKYKETNSYPGTKWNYRNILKGFADNTKDFEYIFRLRQEDIPWKD